MHDPGPYRAEAPSRAEVDAWDGPALLVFGADGCGHCRAAAPAIAQALQGSPGLRVVMVEDGPGRRLGRSFGIKLWPTLVFLRDGREVDRLVRPRDAAPLTQVLRACGPGEGAAVLAPDAG